MLISQNIRMLRSSSGRRWVHPEKDKNNLDETSTQFSARFPSGIEEPFTIHATASWEAATSPRVSAVNPNTHWLAYDIKGRTPAHTGVYIPVCAGTLLAQSSADAREEISFLSLSRYVGATTLGSQYCGGCCGSYTRMRHLTQEPFCWQQAPLHTCIQVPYTPLQMKPT